MAITTPTSLGNTASGSSLSSYTHNTTAAVPAGALIIVCASCGSTAATARTGTMSGGSLTWDKDQEQTFAGTVSVGWTYHISSAQAPSGLASGTTLTWTLSGSAFGGNIAACYVEGQVTSGARDGSNGGASSAGSDYDTGTVSATQAGLAIGGVIIDASVTMTPTGGETELFDFTNPNAWAHHVVYEQVSGAGSVALLGQRDSGTGADKTSAIVVYKALVDPPIVEADYSRFPKFKLAR